MQENFRGSTEQTSSTTACKTDGFSYSLFSAIMWTRDFSMFLPITIFQDSSAYSTMWHVTRALWCQFLYYTFGRGYCDLEFFRTHPSYNSPSVVLWNCVVRDWSDTKLFRQTLITLRPCSYRR